MKYINYIILLLYIFLSACAVGPNFKKPAAPIDTSYTPEDNLTHFGTQQINPHKKVSAVWWQEFASPTLNELMCNAVKNNYTLDAMQQTVAQTQELVNAAYGALWPQIAMNVAVGGNRYGVALFGPANFIIPPYTFYEVGPSLTYVLDLFGATQRTIEKQKALADYQAQEYNAAYISLTGNIAITALSIAILNDQIDTIRQISIEDEKNLAFVTEAFRLGSATKLDVLTAQTQLSSDNALLPELHQQLKVAQNALAVLMGCSVTTWQAPHFALEHFRLPDELPLTLPSELVRTRPDILAAEAQLHAASANIGIATANLYPNITLTAATFQEALNIPQLFNGASNAWTYLANVATPVFNGGMLRAQRRAALHAFDAAFSSYQQIVLQAFAQVNDTLHALKHDEQTENLEKEVMLTAKNNVELAEISFAAGGVGILEIINAQRQYKQAQTRYIQAKGQRYLDTVKLYLVLGGQHPFR